MVFEADDVYNRYPQTVQLTLQAQENAVTGHFDGLVRIEDDDPAPVLSIRSSQVSAAEGTSLTWTFHLSQPLVDGAFWPVQLLPAMKRYVELDTDDVPASYLEEFGIIPPDPAVPLSEIGIFLAVEFAPGARRASLSIPVAADLKDEPDEGVVLYLEGFDDPVVPIPIEFTGVVPGMP